MKSKKGVEKRVVLGILLIGIIISSISFVSAKWWVFGDESEGEGELPETAAARVKVLDANPPIVVFVSSVDDGKGTPNTVTPNYRLTLGGNTSVRFSFLAQQGGGVGNLDPTPGTFNSNATFIRSGSTTRTNLSCITLGQVACGGLCTGNAVNYSCTITMRYYDDPAANWNITATVKDITNKIGINSTKQFTVGGTSAGSTAINYLNWTSPALQTTDTNRYSDNNFTIDNDGNAPIPATRVNATNLTGITNPLFAIQANKFAATPTRVLGVCSGAGFTDLGQDTNPIITGFNVPKATTEVGSNAELSFCLKEVAGLMSQDYNATRLWVMTFIG